MRYLLRCDEIFAVCNIGRAATDEGVRDVFASARQARLSNVGIICTKADVSNIFSIHSSCSLEAGHPRGRGSQRLGRGKAHHDPADDRRREDCERGVVNHAGKAHRARGNITRG